MISRLFLALIVFACYGNTVFNEYSFDDNIPVTDNPHVQKGIRGIPGILTSPYREVGDFKMEYRPVPGILFAIEQEIWKGNPHVSHFLNLLFFALTVILVFHVLIEVFALDKLHWTIPWLIALLYAVHPVNTETVASIKNREQILSMMFALLALLNAYRWLILEKQRTRYVLYTLFFLLLSYLSKMALSIPVAGVIFLTLIFYIKPNAAFKELFIFCVLIFSLSALALSLNIWLSARKVTFLENPLAENHGILATLSFIARTLLFYLKVIFWPHPLRFYYGYNMIPIFPMELPLACISAVIHAGLFAGGVFLFIRNHLIGLFLLCYLFNISFYSNLFPIPGIVAERSLFIALLWFIAAFVILMREVILWSVSLKDQGFAFKLSIAACALLVFVNSAITVNRNFQWKNIESIMQADLPSLKNSAIANYLYAKLLYFDADNATGKKREDLIKESKTHFVQVTEILPAYADPYFRLGIIYEYDLFIRDSAFHYFRLANAHDSKANPIRFQLAKQYFLRNSLDKADSLFALIYNELPQDTMTLFFYTQVLFNKGLSEKALKLNSKLMSLAPQTYYPYYNYGLIYHYIGEEQKAIENLEKTLEIGYNDTQIKNILFNHYMNTGQSDKAIKLDFSDTALD